MSNKGQWLWMVLPCFFSPTIGVAKESTNVRPDTTTGQPQQKNNTSISGFWDTRVGTRLQKDQYEDQTSLAETRLRLNIDAPREQVTYRLKTDLVYDAQEEDRDVDLESGKGIIDLREASLHFSPSNILDIKVGRQTLSWQKGHNALVINDRFPKDNRSFALGRAAEYRKAPSDAIKVSVGPKKAKLDLVYTPRFDANRYQDGSRLSFFNARLNRLSGNDAIVQVDKPDEWFDDDETALRLSSTFNNKEIALYAYRGFWKNPEGLDPRTGKAIFPELDVYGASLKGKIGQYGGGIIEIGYLDSKQDPDGNNPFIRNSETRIRVGIKQALSKKLRIGAQYYVARKEDYDAYKRSVLPGRPVDDESHQIINVRVQHGQPQQKLQLSMTAFYSPSGEDGYVRPKINYQLDKNWAIESGVNWFFGESEQTFFGQLEDNSNVFFGIRYNFPNS